MRRSIDLAEGSISQLVWDADAPPLHFAHANGFNAETYRGLLEPLVGRFHVAASDARGHGFTSLPATAGLARGWTIFRDDLEHIVPDGTILAGHSMGATASLMLAAQRPEKVRALVLVEPVLVPAGVVPGDNDMARRAEKRRDVFGSIEEAFALYCGRGAFKTWPDETLRDYLRGGLEPWEGGMRLSCRPGWEAEDFRSTPPGVSELAAQLRCPVTLIHAADGTASPREVEIFQRLHPATRVIAVPGATHFLPMEFPELVREEITRIANKS